ncbi:MAG: AAA family ATPase, partial [Nitrososphaerales archaeon]
MDTATKSVASGGGRELILLAGEPGQGKTTLVSEFARQAYDRGTTVLLGRCDEEVGAPYRPFREALSHLVAHVDEELLRTHVASHGGELARMVPALGQRLGELPPPQTTDPDTERYLLYAAVVELLEEASRQRPLVLVLDDLHWADKPSLQLLRDVVANSSASQLLILGSYRDGELSTAHPLTDALAALHREPAGVSTIDLKGLEDTGVIAFMESAAGHKLDDAGVGLAHQLYRETDGNPFFVAEVLRNLSESGDIYQDAATGRWTAKEADGELALPHSVRTVIGTRVSRLGEGATKVLSTASVIGRDFDLDLLAETTKVGEDELIDLLEEAQHAAVVNELPDSPGRYSFSHALIQHTLYEDLGATRRTRLHKAVGEAIERLYGENSEDRVGELARHFLLATRPTDADKAISYAQRAGEGALKALAPEEALRYFSQALALASQVGSVEDTRHIDILIGFGTAQRQAGIAEFRANLLEAANLAKKIGDTTRLVRSALANSRGYATLGTIDTDRVEVLEAALDVLPERDSPERARILSTLCSELAYGPLDRRLSLANDAKAIADRLGDPDTLVAVAQDCHMPKRIPALLDETLADNLEALEVAERLGDPVRLCLAAANAFIDATRATRFDLLDRCLSIMEEQAQRVRQPGLRRTSRINHAVKAMLEGNTTQAEELATSVLELGAASGEPDAFGFYGAQLASIRYQQGRMGELVSVVNDLVEQNPGLPAFRSALATASLQAGDEDAARALLEEDIVAGFSVHEDTAWLTTILSYSRVPIELNMAEQAERLLKLLVPFHH